MRVSWIEAALGVIGGGIAWAFGGWSESLTTLIIFMAIDYITGLTVAGVFKKSKKSENGALESRAGFKGLIRKSMVLLAVLVACRLDLLIGTGSFVRDSVIIAFIVNETISIFENMALMGIPLPEAIKKAIDILESKAKEKEDKIHD